MVLLRRSYLSGGAVSRGFKKVLVDRLTIVADVVSEIFSLAVTRNFDDDEAEGYVSISMLRGEWLADYQKDNIATVVMAVEKTLIIVSKKQETNPT